MQSGGAAPIKLFYSYSHRDEELRNELAEHLFPLQRAGLIEVWHDREMLPGDTVDGEIARKLRTADLVLVLVSPSFINSEYCWDIELKNAIERHERGEAHVVPVVLRPCQWQLTPLKHLLAMPTDGRAVINWPNRDTAFDDVARGVAKLAKAMRQKGSKAADPAAAGAKPVAAGTITTGALPPSSPHPAPLPRAGEGDSADAAGTPRPPAGEGGTRDSGRVRAKERALPKDGVYIGVDPRHLPDFAVFRDVDEPWCPEMVVIPAGSFLMGSPPSEPERSKNEGPHHRVTIDYRFAIGRYAVTFEEYDHFCEETNREKPADQGWGRGRQPAINVSWQDAMAFCGWLGKETGKPYRLLSEAEWEYACRAGTTTAFSFGETVTPSQVNYDGNYTYARGAKGVYRKRTVGVGSLPANPWGLHEVHGNVWEWLEDVWHDNYSGAPVDGTAWTDGEGINSDLNRVLRGGSWYFDPRYCRSAFRYGGGPDGRINFLGFRLARTLD